MNGNGNLSSKDRIFLRIEVDGAQAPHLDPASLSFKAPCGAGRDEEFRAAGPLASRTSADTAQKATQNAQEHGGAPQGGNHAPNALDALPDASPPMLGASGDARPADREGATPSPRLGSSAPVLFWQGGGGVPRFPQVTPAMTRAGVRARSET